MLIVGQVVPGQGADSRISESELQSRCGTTNAKLVKGTLNLRVDSVKHALKCLGQPDFSIRSSGIRWWQIELFLPSEHDWTAVKGKTFVVAHQSEGPRLYIMSEIHFRDDAGLVDYSIVKLRKITRGQLSFEMDIAGGELFESRCHVAKSDFAKLTWKLEMEDIGGFLHSLGRCDFETPPPDDDKHNNLRWWQIELILEASPENPVASGKTFIFRRHFQAGNFLRLMSEIDFRAEPALRGGGGVQLPAACFIYRRRLNAD